MAEDRDTVEFVVGSSVRRNVIREALRGRTETEELLETLDASSSAVYNALTVLQERGVLRETDVGWQLTGVGRFLADVLEHRCQLHDLFEDVEEYFRTHDTGVLPRQFRYRAGELAGATTVEATATEPHRAVQEVVDYITRAEVARVISPVYTESYESAMPDTADSRLLITPDIAESSPAAEEVPYESLSVRILDVDFALGVTEEALLLSLPDLDGNYDASTELVAEHETARTWGVDLFEHCWQQATPLDAVTADD